MSLEELEEEAEARLQEAKSLAERLRASANASRSIHKNMVKELLKWKLIADINKETQKTLKEVEENLEYRRRHPELVEDVWIHAFLSKSEDVLVHRVAMKMWSDTENAKPKSLHIRSVLAKEYRSRLDDLKSSIEEGKMDNELDISPREAIWVYVFNVDHQ